VQQGHKPSIVGGVVCLTSKPSIGSYTHRPALRSTARRNRCLATDGSVLARRVLPRPPVRPSVRPTHDIRAVTSGLSAQRSTDLHWKQLGNF